jgi:hypothetical protein
MEDKSLERPDPLVAETKDLEASAATSGDVSIDVPRNIDLSLEDPHSKKEEAAKGVALRLVGVFGVATIILLLGGILFLAPHLLKSDPGSTDLPALLESYGQYLDQAKDFLTVVFGPLLAFVLGYYFGKSDTSKKTGDPGE